MAQVAVGPTEPRRRNLERAFSSTVPPNGRDCAQLSRTAPSSSHNNVAARASPPPARVTGSC